MKTIIPVVAGFLLGAVPAATQAALLSLQPASASVGVGASVEVALTISGLGDGSAPSLGVFDVDLTYDPAVLQFDSVAFGDPVLGDQLDLSGLGAVTGFDASVAGAVNHFELSLDSVADLDALQAGAFTLSVFRFTALNPGVSPVELSLNSLGDAQGDPLAAQWGGARLTVIPEPASVGLWFAMGSAAWIVFRRGRSRQ